MFYFFIIEEKIIYLRIIRDRSFARLTRSCGKYHRIPQIAGAVLFFNISLYYYL